jgi:O-antigen ligase
MSADGPPGAPAAPRAALPLALLAACLLLPLAVAPTAYVFPYVTTRSVALFALVPAAAASYACLFLVRRAPPLRRPGPALLGAAAFVASAALSTACGVDPRLGLWDTGERLLGVSALVLYGVWALLALACARDDRHWRTLLRVSLAAGGIAAGGAVLQALRVLDLPGDGRATSTLGQATYVGSLGLHLVFLGAAFASSAASRGDAWFGRAAALLGAGAVAASVTRSAGIGLAAGAAAFAAWRFLPRIGRRGAAVSLVAAAAVCAGAVAVARTTSFTDAVPILRRLAGTSASDATVETRLLAWDAALDAARERPLLGWGFNAYPHALDAHFPPRLLRHGAAETWFDDAHGVVFNVLAEQGVLGVAAWAAAVAGAFVSLRRGIRSGRFSAGTGAALAGWLVAHLGHLAFSFEDLTSAMHLALVLAWIDHASSPPRAHAPPPLAERPLVRLAAAGACSAAAAGAFAFGCVQSARESSRVRATLASVESFPVASAAAMERIATSGSPGIRTAAALYAWTVLDRLPAIRRSGRAEEGEVAARSAFDLLARVAAEAPRDLRPVLLRAKLLESSVSVAAEASSAEQVRRELVAARAFAPRRQQVAFALADVELRTGRADDAAATLRRAVAEDPGGAGGWARLAAVYRHFGRIDDARRIVREARERGVEFGPGEERFVRGLTE